MSVGPEPEWLRKMRPMERLFVLYDREEGLWHERVLLARVGPWCWAVLTPTMDLHEEDFAEALEIAKA